MPCAFLDPGNCCPQCEGIFVDSVGNIAEYPENYTSWNCTHCNLLIGEIDNSPFSSIWDWDENEVTEAYTGIIEVIDTMERAIEVFGKEQEYDWSEPSDVMRVVRVNPPTDEN